MQRHKKLSARILSMALTVAMVCTIMPSTVFAAEGDVPLGASSMTECHPAHDEDCGYLEALEGVACSHLNEDGTYSCAPVLDSGDVSGNAATSSDAEKEYVCDHTDGCGYVEAVEGIPCTHECEQCKVVDSGKPEDKPRHLIPCADEDKAYEYLETLISGDISSLTDEQKSVLDEHRAVCAICDGILIALTPMPLAGTDAAALQSIIDAASASSTVTLDSDYAFGTTGVTVNKDLTLDLNGHAITYSGNTAGTGAFTVSGSSSFTITGAEGSTLNSTGNSSNSYALFNSGTGTVTVSGGTLTAPNGNGRAIGNNSTGTITINGGTVSAMLSYAIYNASTGIINVTGGVVMSNTLGTYAIVNKGSGTVNISGGTVLATGGEYASVIANSGTVNVSGGTISATTANNAISNFGNDTQINITGGSVTGVTLGQGTMNAVEKYTFTLKNSGGSTANSVAVESLALTPEYTYGMADVMTDANGNIYIWLPSSAQTTAATATVSSSAGSASGTYESGSTAITGKAADLIKAGPSITVGTQPTATTTVTYGAITGTLLVAGTADNSNPVSYQWYKSTTNSATGGTAVTGAASASFTIPTTLDAGTHYYYCVLSATDCAEKASNVAAVTVNKANATDAMKTVAATVSKNGATGATATLPTKPAAATYGTITYGGTITCSNASVNGDTLTYTAPASTVGATGTITIPVTTATNYNDYSIVVTITSTDKKAATITAAVADKTYNGVAVTQPTPTAVEKDTTTPVTLTYTYKWQKSNGSGGYTDISSNTAPKDAGSYKLVIEGSSDTHAGTTEIAFTISKATVTITADNKSAYVGDAKPTLTYTATGLVSGDTLATVPTLTYESEPDMSKAGSVKIKASGAVVPNTDNYESAITYVDGILTISNKSSGGGGGGGSSSGGGSSTPTPPPAKPTEPVKGESNTTATVDKNGNATTTVTDKNIADAVKAAKDAANKKGVNAGEITAVINVTAPANSNPNTVTVNLPKTVQQQVINNKINNVAIVIDKPDISIGMNLATITEMNKQANADIQLSATRTDATKLSTEAKNAIGDRPAFDLKATYNSGAKSITSFGSGSVSVAIPYTLQSGEVAGGLYAVYIDGNGKANYITGSSYDANTKMLRFATNHFSVYGIGYKAPSAFTDIAGHWAKTDIEFVVNRGLMSATSNTTFAPNGSMTRGMFVTALGRLAGVDTNSYKTGKFTDVKADAYDAPYVNWAASKGITNGTTATTFSPDSTVTRQEIAVFMSNYAKAMGYKVPETREAVTFADNGSIGSWAAAAVKQMQMAGVLNGKNGNKFDPTGTATRAEVAAVLHRYVELVIDRSTAQGLDTNDSGSAMMYENGKAVKSASRTVGSATYNFNANGEAALLPADSKKTGT